MILLVIVSLVPADDSGNAAVEGNLVIIFDENVQKGTAGNIVITQTGGATFETIPVTDVRVSVTLSWRDQHDRWNKIVTADDQYFDAISLHKYSGSGKDDPEDDAKLQTVLAGRKHLAGQRHLPGGRRLCRSVRLELSQQSDQPLRNRRRPV